MNGFPRLKLLHTRSGHYEYNHVKFTVANIKGIILRAVNAFYCLVTAVVGSFSC